MFCVMLHAHTYTHTHTHTHRQHKHWHVATDDSFVIMRRYLIMAFAVIFLVVMVIVLVTRVGRGVADRDPNLDWRMNPNLRTGD